MIGAERQLSRRLVADRAVDDLGRLPRGSRDRRGRARRPRVDEHEDPPLRGLQSLRENAVPHLHGGSILPIPRRRVRVAPLVRRLAEGIVLRVERLEERDHDPELVVQLFFRPVDHRPTRPLPAQTVIA